MHDRPLEGRRQGREGVELPGVGEGHVHRVAGGGIGERPEAPEELGVPEARQARIRVEDPARRRRRPAQVPGQGLEEIAAPELPQGEEARAQEPAVGALPVEGLVERLAGDEPLLDELQPEGRPHRLKCVAHAALSPKSHVGIIGTMPDDRRTGGRYAVGLLVKLKHPDVGTFVERFATNISPGGMFIRTRDPKDPGTMVRFEVQIAGGSG